MRLVRVPYFYLPNLHVVPLHASAYRLLLIIHDIHHGIPNKDWDYPQVKAFMYHPSFLRWVFLKARCEMLARKMNPKVLLPKRLIGLKSRSLSDFIPPTDTELAEDVVWLLLRWQTRLRPGGKKLPQSYVDLALNSYGDCVRKASHERVDENSGHHRDYDREWYNFQSERYAAICNGQVGEVDRIHRDGKGE